MWSINSTALGGGVAEMQRTLWPYWRAAGLDARWLVMNGSRDFFRFTKRLHNLLHGRGMPRPGPRDRALFEQIGRAAAAEAAALVAPGDVVVLQDPQTAALASPLRRAGASVVWRCHVGADAMSPPVEAAWSFLLPYVEEADAFVFTRRAFVPDALPAERVTLLSPAIDPRSEKNRPMVPGAARVLLDRWNLALLAWRTGSSSPSGAGTGSRTRLGSCTRLPTTSKTRGRSSSSPARRWASSPTTRKPRTCWPR